MRKETPEERIFADILRLSDLLTVETKNARRELYNRRKARKDVRK